MNTKTLFLSFFILWMMGLSFLSGLLIGRQQAEERTKKEWVGQQFGGGR